MAEQKWPNRARFVDLVLAWGVARGYVNLRTVEFDGVAGGNFDKVTKERAGQDADQLIGLALKTGVPVEGLVEDGVLGRKWLEVVDLAKQPDRLRQCLGTRPM